MDLLSPASAFRFPMPGGDCQSLQRHRSTSTPNVHMVSTVGPTGINIIEVSFGFWFVLMKQQTDKTRPLWKQTDAITSPQSLQLLFGSCCTDNIRVLHYLNHKRNMLLLLNPPMPCLRYSRQKDECKLNPEFKCMCLHVLLSKQRENWQSDIRIEMIQFTSYYKTLRVLNILEPR